MDSGEEEHILPEKIYDHPAHEHEMVLCRFQARGRCDADRCHISYWDAAYECGSCKFKMHRTCAGVKPQDFYLDFPRGNQMEPGELDSLERIHDPAHAEHDLVLGHYQGIGGYCSLCESNIKKGDEIYECETRFRFDYCPFRAHKACCSIKAKINAGESNLPRRIYRHPAHYDHELVLGQFPQSDENYVGHCDAYRCPNRYIITGKEEIYEWGHRDCSSCKFKMHSACAGIKGQINDGELDSSERIRHPDHKHRLVLCHFQGNGDSWCAFCKDNFKEEDEIYSCETSSRFDYCHFSIHKSCSSINAEMDAGGSNFPKKIYGHPAHEDELVNKKTAANYFERDSCYAYHCSELIEPGDEMYACESCPRQDCEFKMHSACAGVKAQVDFHGHVQVDAGEPDSSERVHHPAHDHALVLRQHQATGDSSCSSCQKNVNEGDEIYTCETSSRFDFCRFSIHEACSSIQADAGEANLPEIITHPDHEGGLVLGLYRGYRSDQHCSTCSVCRMKRHKKGDEIYVCGNSSHSFCDFNMDTACSSIKGEVHFRGHKPEHPLVFLERISSGGRLECGSCGGELSNKPMFRCMLCKDPPAFLHLLCGPLPISIPYHFAGYDLNLTLKDTLLDGVDPEDSWCDICEVMRDPGKCVYRSEDPPFTAATDCLLPQIARALKGHCGEVQLRTVRGHLPGVVRPFAAQGSTKPEVAEQKKLLDDDTEEVIEESELANNNGGTISLEQLENSVTQEEEEQLQALQPEYPEFAHGEKVIPFKFSDEAFELFKEHVAIKGELGLSASGYEEDPEFIKEGDNLVPQRFVSLYRQLIEKHGAFTADSPLSQATRAFVLLFFLGTLKEVLGLQTHQVTGDLLCTLQYSWKRVACGLGGFSLQFALDNLEKVARTCYALKLIEVRDGITRDLTQQIQHLMKEIEVDKPQIEALGVQYGRAKKGSAFGKQCPLKLSKLQWKSAGEFLGLDPEE